MKGIDDGLNMILLVMMVVMVVRMIHKQNNCNDHRFIIFTVYNNDKSSNEHFY